VTTLAPITFGEIPNSVISFPINRKQITIVNYPSVFRKQVFQICSFGGHRHSADPQIATAVGGTSILFIWRNQGQERYSFTNLLYANSIFCHIK
jgi:hypothetical protein